MINVQLFYRRGFLVCLGASILCMFALALLNVDKVLTWVHKFPEPQRQQNVVDHSNGPLQAEKPRTTLSREPPVTRHSLQVHPVNQTSKLQKNASPSGLMLVVELFPNWTTKDPKDLVITHRFYLYSAIVNIHESPRASYHGTAIHIVGFQDERSYTKLKCCLKLSNSDHVQSGGMATIDHQFPSDRNTHLKTFGMVYRCVFPNTSQQLRGGHVTLSPTSCPGDLKQYLTIHHPEVKPGGLAICAKVAYGFQLNLDVLVEWLELQRILGVDKIQLFDLNNTEVVHKVFRHYQDMGLLEIMPYKLPGKTWGRSMLKNGTDYANFGDDEELVNWECRLRLAGYDYVMHLDMDEVLMPRHFKALKPYLKQEFAQYPGAASVHFHRLLFLVDWQPADPKTSLHFLRYLNYMDSPDDAGKHVYIPRRTHQTYTHGILPYMGFRSIWFIKNTVASVFHYRTCKMNWEFNCKVPGTPNTAMLRFSNELVLAVSSAREQLGLHPLKQGGQVA